MAINNFKSFGIGAGANVTSQADYEALSALLTGFQSGKASSAQINKALRQSSTMAYVLAQFISDSASVDVLDNGTPATILSNLKASMTALTPGRLLNIQIITATGNYNKTAGTKKAKALAVGGGGAGGGTAITDSSTIASGWGGNGGSYGETNLIDVSAISTVAVTIGAGGVRAAGAKGGDGGATSFGSYLIAPGGVGGNYGAKGAAGSLGPDNANGSECSGTSVALSVPGKGGGAPFNISIQSNGIKSGRGGDSPFGTGGGAINGTTTPIAGSGKGAGGGGNAAGPGATSAIAGANGTDGLVIVLEYA